MSTIDITALACVSPGVLERASRVRFAADLLNRDVDRTIVRKRIQSEFAVSKATANRTIDMARDLA